MNDIDWLSVQMVVFEGKSLPLRTAADKRMAIRRLDDRMLSAGDWYWSSKTAAKLTAKQVAERMHTTERSVQRIQSELPPADRRVCSACGEPAWVYPNGIVEPHPTRMLDDCELSGKLWPLRGLAAIRPDLYQWVAS